MTTTYRSVDEVRQQAPDEMAAHLRRSKELHAEGVLVMAGAFLDPGDGALQTMGVLTSRSAAEDYARHDPFVEAGMVRHWEIRPWANMLA